MANRQFEKDIAALAIRDGGPNQTGFHLCRGHRGFAHCCAVWIDEGSTNDASDLLSRTEATHANGKQQNGDDPEAS